MPVTKLSVGLTTAGALCVAACRLAWHKKATTPFRFAYFFSWPTLGTGLILLAQPENNNMVEVSRPNRHRHRKEREREREREKEREREEREKRDEKYFTLWLFRNRQYYRNKQETDLRSLSTLLTYKIICFGGPTCLIFFLTTEALQSWPH